METKTCKVCGVVRPATTEFFHKKKDGRYGLVARCKNCRKKEGRERYEQNHEKIKKQVKIYAGKNREKVRENEKQWRSKNKARIRDSNRKRYSENPTRRIGNNLSNNTRNALKGTYKSSSTIGLLGCSIEECQKHLEDQFQEGMIWDNYGNPNGDHTDCWHVDHIRPCASFDLTQEDQQRVCFHYTNLQPLWAKDNLSKGDKWNE